MGPQRATRRSRGRLARTPSPRSSTSSRTGRGCPVMYLGDPTRSASLPRQGREASLARRRRRADRARRGARGWRRRGAGGCRSGRGPQTVVVPRVRRAGRRRERRGDRPARGERPRHAPTRHPRDCNAAREPAAGHPGKRGSAGNPGRQPTAPIGLSPAIGSIPPAERSETSWYHLVPAVGVAQALPGWVAMARPNREEPQWSEPESPARSGRRQGPVCEDHSDGDRRSAVSSARVSARSTSSVVIRGRSSPRRFSSRAGITG